MQITSNIIGLNEFERNLKDRATNMKPLTEKLGKMAHDDIMKNFDNEGRYQDTGVIGGNTKWQKLKPDTIKNRIRLGYQAGPILKMSGKLKNSIKVDTDGKTILVTSDVIYANTHQYGYPGKNIPARPFVNFQKEEIEKMKQEIRDFFYGIPSTNAFLNIARFYNILGSF